MGGSDRCGKAGMMDFVPCWAKNRSNSIDYKVEHIAQNNLCLINDMHHDSALQWEMSTAVKLVGGRGRGRSI